MGRRRCAKRLPLSAHRLSRKKGHVLRRKMLKLQNAQLNHNTNIKNETTNYQSSVGVLPDINSESNTEMRYCLSQIKEEQMDEFEIKTETYDEEGALNGTNKDFIFVNVNSIEETEGYNEDGYNKKKCNENGYNEDAACNENIEFYENSKDLISINGNNIEKIGDFIEEKEEESTCNEIAEIIEIIEYYDYEDSRDGIKYFTNKKDNERRTIDINCPTLHLQEEIPTGRCIINFHYFWSEAHKIFNNHSLGSDCQFRHWKLVNYRRRGLLTQFFFKCQMCRFEGSIWSEPVDTKAKTPDLNAIAVASSVAAGMGFAEFRRSFEYMDITCMSHTTYLKHRRNLFEIQNNIKSIANGVVLNEN